MFDNNNNIVNNIIHNMDIDANVRPAHKGVQDRGEGELKALRSAPLLQDPAVAERLVFKLLRFTTSTELLLRNCYY